MQAYLEIMRHILEEGNRKDDRTGVGTLSVFGQQSRYNLQHGFPLVTTKKVNFAAIVHELLWFISGDTNIRYLVQNGVNIWNEWPFRYYLQAQGLAEQYPQYSEEWKKELQAFKKKIKEDEAFAQQWGELGPVYGKQWRNFEGVDQLADVIQSLRRNPHSRRHIVSAWNPPEIPAMAESGLPPCHTLFQFYVANNRLSCQLYQRSADVFLGVPFNIASYALLTHLMAQACDLEVGDLVHTLGDAHLYSNHLDQAREQLQRPPRRLPQLKLKPDVQDLFNFKFEDIQLENYEPHPPIKAPIAV